MTGSSNADRTHTNLNSVEAMHDHITGMMPKEMASAANLFAHPVAGMVAASAVGFGMASQAFGMWLGVLGGVAEASQRMLQPLVGNPGGAGPAAAPSRSNAESGAEASRPRAAPALRLVETPVAAVAAKKGPRPPQGMEKPARPDDLKAISGVGPKLEAVLNGHGIWTYGQIADWSADEIDWVEGTLGFRGRVGRDDWLGQAVALRNRQRVK